MKGIDGLEIHCGFRNDYGISEMLSPYAKLHFGLNENKTIKLLNKYEYDIVIIIDSEEYVNAIRKSSHRGLVFVEVHTSIDKNLKYLSKLKRNDLHAFIVVSEYIMKKINHHVSEEVINKPVLTFPNVVDTSLFKHTSLPKNPVPIIGWVGKIDDHKDWKTYFRICSRIKKFKSEVEFWIAGGETCSDELAQEVLSYAEELDIISRLRWFDRIENYKMAEFYSTIVNSGGFCLVTSQAESFGMSIIESLLSGCPIISSKVGAIPEITDMESYLQFYNLGDTDSAVELCLTFLEEGIKIDTQSKIEILEDRYSSLTKSKYYIEMLEFFHANDLAVEINIDYERIYVSNDSPVKIDKIFDPKSLMKPLNYPSPKLSLPDNYPEQKLRVACIMDEFSFNSYRDEFELLNLSLATWESDLEQFNPDFFFLESAWKGKEFEWEHKINRLDHELLELLNWFRTKNIPIIFWNKEDPVHFNTFLSAANQCDYIFTTDIDCISEYKKKLYHENIYLLPFAANLNQTNPIILSKRNKGACFAGAYYAKYLERAKNLSSMISAISQKMPLDIYDRFYGTLDERYSFPEDYQKYILGTLPYDQIDIAYKGYEYGINMNSVKQSQTMFARRVFELMASNTLVVSNFSRAMRIQFGDLVISSDDESEIINRIDSSLHLNEKMDKIKLIALRTTLLTNSYKQRAEYIISKISNMETKPVLDKITVIGLIENMKQYKLILQNFNRQNYSNKQLLLISDNDLEKHMDESHILINTTKDNLSEKLGQEISSSNYVSFFKSTDYYCQYFLLDLLLTKNYSDCEIFTKKKHYSHYNGQILVNEGEELEYSLVESADLDCSLIRNNDLTFELIKQKCQIQTNKFNFQNFKIISTDRFNYCKNFVDRNGSIDVFDSESLLINDGVDIDDYLLLAESISVEEKVYSSGNTISKDWLFENLSTKSDDRIKITIEDEGLLITSKLSPNEHKYFYSKQDVVSKDIFQEVPGLFFEKSPGLDIMFVILYLNNEKKRLGNQVLTANTNHRLEIPEDTEFFRYGIRIRSSGACVIENIELEERDLTPPVIISKNKNLLIANNYPSYSDLYRNQFLHSRIVEYKSRGKDFDIFILKPDSAIDYYEYHDVDVIRGSKAALARLLQNSDYENIFVHFMDEDMWSCVKDIDLSVNLSIWAHGAEIQPYERRKFNYSTKEEHNNAKLESKLRMKFWKKIFSSLKENMKMIFVSEYFSKEVFADIGIKLKKNQYEVIHNPIDTNRFSFKKRDIELRKKILSIRTFASRKYANDITVKVILELSKHKEFEDMEFLIAGDGILFDEVTAPLTEFSNVELRKGFLSSDEYTEIFDDFGIFLVPTRWDSQGVSRDEAMSAGVVPVTNAVSAISEFADDSCAILADDEDHIGLANGILKLYNNPETFSQMSNNAGRRVRKQTAAQITISKELELIGSE